MTNTNRKKLFDSAKRVVVEEISGLIKRSETRLPTARQLAKFAQCSYSTMRLVLAEMEKEGFVIQQQGSGTYVTDEAKKLVSQFLVKKLLYCRPPRVSIASADDYYDEWLAVNLQQEAKVRNWNVTSILVSSHDEFLSNMMPLIHQYDAIAYAPVSEPFTLDQIASMRALQDKPFVLLGDQLSTGIHSVSIDNRRGGAMAASQLLANNHRDIALLIGEPRGVKACEERVTGFSEMLEIAGIRPVIIDPKITRDANRYEYSYRAMTKALNQGLKVSAVFTVSDYSAWGTLEAFKDAGVKVPEEVSIIGFDGLPFVDKLTPQLSTIRHPLPEILSRMFEVFESYSGSNYATVLSPEFKAGASIKRLPSNGNLSNPFQPLSNKTFVLKN